MREPSQHIAKMSMLATSSSAPTLPMNLPESSVLQEENKVWFVLLVIFFLTLLISLVCLKFLSEDRQKLVVPFVTYLGFSSSDYLYRKWTNLINVYGMKPFQFAFARVVLTTLTARLLLSSSFVAVPPSTSDNVSKHSHLVVRCAYFFWYPLIGILWGMEEMKDSSSNLGFEFVLYFACATC